MSCNAPRCTTTELSGGTFADAGMYQLPSSAGCQHAVPTVPEISSIMRGNWLLLCGASNIFVHAIAYANLIVPGSAAGNVGGCCGNKFADFVYDVSGSSPSLEYEKADGSTWMLKWPWEDCAYDGRCGYSKKVGAHTANRLRVTWYNKKTWPDCSEFLEASASAGDGWGSAPTIWMAQAGEWYQYGGAASKYKSELSALLKANAQLCQSATRHCFVMGMDCGQMPGASRCNDGNLQIQRDARSLVGSYAASTYRLLDVEHLVTAAPMEMPGRHVTPFIAIWSLIPAINALPGAADVLGSRVSGCASAAAFEDKCRAYAGGKSTGCGNDFMCFAKRPCAYTVTGSRFFGVRARRRLPASPAS